VAAAEYEDAMPMTGKARRIGGVAPPLAGLLLAAACTLPPAGLTGPDAAARPPANRTPVDLAVSLIAGKDCSVVRQSQGLTYCREDEPRLPVAVRCYRSLGDVACHAPAAPVPGRPEPIGGPAGRAALVPEAAPPSPRPAPG
jgi:hypothetical protein